MYWNDLDLSSRSKLMELYLKNGITSLTAMKEHYNSLQDGGKLTFKQWKEKMQQKYPDIEMDNSKAGYDYETYFNDNYNEAVAQLNNLRHFPDTYKLYNHPTFSNESIYSRGPMIGGSWGYTHPWDTQWSNTEGFTPSIVNRQVHPEIYKEDRPYTEDEIYSHRFDDGGPVGDKHSTPDNSIDLNTQTTEPIRNVEQVKWFNDWYSNRQQQLEDHFNNITDIYDLPKDKTPLSYVTEAINVAMNTPVENKFSFNYKGQYFPGGKGLIYINPIRTSSGKASTLLHERTHAINTNLPRVFSGNRSYSPIEADIYNKNKEYYDNSLKQNGEIEYYDRPEEIYSRLMQFRYDKNVDPTYKWTEEDINNLRKEGFLGIFGNSLRKFNLDQYPNSFLLYLFNDVAQNNTSTVSSLDQLMT